jgi:hypothetical protein
MFHWGMAAVVPHFFTLPKMEEETKLAFNFTKLHNRRGGNIGTNARLSASTFTIPCELPAGKTGQRVDIGYDLEARAICVSLHDNGQYTMSKKSAAPTISCNSDMLVAVGMPLGEYALVEGDSRADVRVFVWTSALSGNGRNTHEAGTTVTVMEDFVCPTCKEPVDPGTVKSTTDNGRKATAWCDVCEKEVVADFVRRSVNAPK